jgi:hypothetical protein
VVDETLLIVGERVRVAANDKNELPPIVAAISAVMATDKSVANGASHSQRSTEDEVRRAPWSRRDWRMVF